MRAYRLREFGTVDGIAMGEEPVPEPATGPPAKPR